MIPLCLAEKNKNAIVAYSPTSYLLRKSGKTSVDLISTRLPDEHCRNSVSFLLVTNLPMLPKLPAYDKYGFFLSIKLTIIKSIARR